MSQDQLKQLHALNKHTQTDRKPVKWIEVDLVVTFGCASPSVESFAFCVAHAAAFYTKTSICEVLESK